MPDSVLLVGRIGLTVGDGTDAGSVWCSAGTVRLIPVTPVTHVDAAPVPFLGARASIDLPIDSAGYVTWRDARHAPFLDLTAEGVNPPVAAGNATHRIEFRDLTADLPNDTRVSVPTWSEPIRISADKTATLTDAQADAYGLPHGTAVVDLASAVPMPTADGITIAVGPPGASITSLEVEGNHLVATLSNGNTITTTDLPLAPGAILAVYYTDGAWPPRPTDRTDVTVAWIGASGLPVPAGAQKWRNTASSFASRSARSSFTVGNS